MLHIAVGTRMYIQLGDAESEDKLSCELIGIKGEEFLIVSTAVYPGIITKLHEGRRVTIRYVYCGGVYGFHSSILAYYSKPSLMLILSYPKTIESLNLRTGQRAECRLPVKATIETVDFQGLVLDISTDGCRLAIQIGEQDNVPAVKPRQHIAVCMPLAGIAGTQTVNGTIMNVRQTFRVLELGVKFDETDACVKENIQCFAKSILELGNIPQAISRP